MLLTEKDKILKIASRQRIQNLAQSRRRPRRCKTPKKQSISRSSPCVIEDQAEDEQQHSRQTSYQYRDAQRSHYYGAVSISGNAHVHLGDSYVTNYTFDRMPTSQPWLYTMEETLPKIYVYFGFRGKISRTQTLIRYYMLARIDNRIIRVGIALLISSNHELWHFVSIDKPIQSTPMGPPKPLLSGILRFLLEQDDLPNDYHALLVPSQGSEHSPDRTRLMQGAGSNDAIISALRNLSNLISWSDCPWYLEDELDYRPLFPERQSSQLLARVQGEWVYVTRFILDRWLFNNCRHTMKILQYLDGTPGFARFYGVVRDSTGLITALLNELPAHGRLDRVFSNAIKHRNPIPLQQRLKWCKQLVQCVAAGHAKGLALGIPGLRTKSPIGVDRHGDICLYSFEGLSKPQKFMPPELDHRYDFWATFTTDIYQLGLVLWRIAGHRFGPTSKEICRDADSDCQLNNQDSCLVHYKNTVMLPMLSDNYPQYLRDIILACREVNPSKRASASSLLKMFPVDVDATIASNHGSNPFANLDEHRRGFAFIYSCSNCEQSCDNHRFHCNICRFSNFDICARCFFERGLHCDDDQHSLREYYIDTTVDRCYSNVMPDGKRREWVLTNVDLEAAV